MSIVQFFCWKYHVWQAYVLQMCKSWNRHPLVISSPLGRHHGCVKFGGLYTDFLFHRTGWAAQLPTVNKILLPCTSVETLVRSRSVWKWKCFICVLFHGFRTFGFQWFFGCNLQK
jgi:hypothetical protein